MDKEIMWHNISWEQAIKKYDSDIEQGLTEKQIANQREKFGLNELPKEKPLSNIKIFLDQIKSPLIYVLIVAGMITLFFQLYTDSIVIFAAVFLNTIVGFFQEKKAYQALGALKKVVKTEARVIRDGHEKKIGEEELVPGDIIILSAGNKAPADARIIESHNLKINEAALTGEWLAQEKSPKKLNAETPLADRDNMVYMGTIVENGIGKAIVVETGHNSEMGKIAISVKQTEEQKTPLQKKLSKFSAKIGLIIAVLCIYIFIGGVMEGRDYLEMFTTAVAVAVAAIPEGLPVAMTVILTLGMSRIVQKKGLVRKLISAETLGSTSVIATDKTLTLTEGKMKAKEIVTADSEISIETEDEIELFKRQANKEQILAMKIAVLSNEAFVENPDDFYPVWKIQGNPTDKAFALAGAKLGFEKQKLQKQFPKIDELPFNSENKFLATLHATTDENLLQVLGAPEKILDFSTKIEIKGEQKTLDKKYRQNMKERLKNMTERGERVIAIAYKKIPRLRSCGSFGGQSKLKNEVENLTFVGFIGLKDPIRKEAKNAIQVCRQAGMKPIIVTGDHKLTAKAVALELGFKIKSENIMEGNDLDALSDKEFGLKVKDIQVYARAEPRHKLRIIKAWQDKGEVVAMTGDGINDAPALKKADIGVALGSGTDVAKQVSDLVLLNDNFNIILAAVEEGRAIIDNIRKVITYLLSDSFTETILIGVSIIFCLPMPVLAVQILWVNLIEDGLPGIALAFEKKEKDLMKRKPEKRNISLLTTEMKALIFIIGLITDILLLGLFFWLLKFSGYELPHVQSIIFAALTIDSLFYVFSCKSLRRNIWDINIFSNKLLIFSWAFGVIALVSALYVPALQTLLGTIPLNLFDWELILALGFLNIILIEATKWFFITKARTIENKNQMC